MSRVAFLFPGQGAQRAGMGKDFYEVSAVARKVIDEAGEWLGLDLKKLCFEEDERLNQTEYTQAALLTVCLAMEKTLETYGIFPEVTAGLSLGEYCAIETAGALSLKDAVLTVRKRGLLMEEAVPAGVGAMAAVLGMDAAAIQAVIQNREGVWIANDNCPGQLVITGEKTAVEEVGILLKEAGARRVLPLKVSGPFHSPLLNTAGEKLAEVLAPCKLSGLKIPYISNTLAEPVTDKTKIKDLLTRHISSPVRWRESMEELIREGVGTFIEIGPGKTLSGFLKKIDRNAVVYSIQTMEDLEKTVELLKGRNL